MERPRSEWSEQGESGLLLRDRNLLELMLLGGIPVRGILRFFYSYAHVQLMWKPSTLVKSLGPALSILEKQDHLMISVRLQKKLDSSVTCFAFQGF